MRALYFPHDPSQGQIEITGVKLHHLVNVIRIEQGEELLLLDGIGTKTLTTVSQITKKSLLVTVKSHSITLQGHGIHLALGIPKRESLDLSLKEATELGVKKIFLVRSDFSQSKVPESERLENVLISALEQANAPFMPEIVEMDWNSLPWQDYSEVTVMNSQANVNDRASQSPGPEALRILVVGPEGGFSPCELKLFTEKGARNLLLPTPILRTPTAVAAGLGFILGTLLD